MTGQLRRITVLTRALGTVSTALVPRCEHGTKQGWRFPQAAKPKPGARVSPPRCPRARLLIFESRARNAVCMGTWFPEGNPLLASSMQVTARRDILPRGWRADRREPLAVEVLAHHAIEVKNVVHAKGAAWSLKAWFDLSSDDSAGPRRRRWRRSANSLPAS